jgi:two-component system, chemotaxis family, protein-glutamate methylesterase/glutaminase
MAAIKVLIVDDSITMRALFTHALERSKDLVVVGAAAGADDARAMIAELRPDVLTLDVEMPGMNGIDFLAEIMATRPMPVVMLSTLTQKGADVSLRALEIGAVDCFPKPQKATPDEFDKISGRLCKLVATAARSNVSARRAAPATPATPMADDGYRWDGSLVTVTAGMGGVEALSQMLAGFPASCPPVLIVHAMEDGLAVPFASKLNRSIAPTVKLAADGLPLDQGTVYLAADPRWHVAIDRWPEGRIRFVDREPVNGQRPSADLLFGVLAKAAGSKTAAVILSGAGNDGAAGMAMLKAAGARTYAQDAATALVHEAAAAAIARGGVAMQLPPEELGAAILGGTREEILI